MQQKGVPLAVKHGRDLTIAGSTFKHGNVWQGQPAKVVGEDNPVLLLSDKEEGVGLC